MAECDQHTKEWDARGISLVQCFSVIREVLSASHQLPHNLQSGLSLLVDLSPCAAQTVNGCCAQGRDDRGESRIIVELATFLKSVSCGNH